MKLGPLSPDASRLEAVIWWRNWMAILTICSFVVLLILLLIQSADWILLLVLPVTVLGTRQVGDLTWKAEKLSR